MKNSDVQREIDRMTESRKMNKRIRELAEKVGSTHKQSLGVYQFYTDELEKFAKLIVRECVGIVSKRKNQAIDDGWNVDEAMSMAEIDLEKHFGVEE